MAPHFLDREQFLPISLEDAWSFFSSPLNLARITPPELGLELLAPFDGRAAHTGQLIRYRVRPILRIALNWTTRMESVDGPYRFIDTQLDGPYRLWRHTHTFTPVPGGVHMKDRVEYRLPYGVFGDLFHGFLVRPRLERIFDYRKNALDAIFAPLL